MQQFLGHYRKQPREVLDYTVDYTSWLKAAETLSDVQYEVDITTAPALAVGPIFFTDATDKAITFKVASGVSSNTYKVTLLATTSLGQIVEREIQYTVEEI